MTKRLEDYEWICPEPFTGLTVRAQGTVMPCCANHGPRLDKPEQVQQYIKLFGNNITNYEKDMSLFASDNLDNVYTSKTFTTLKQALKDNNREVLNTACNTCIKQEQAGKTSHRQWYINRYNNQFASSKGELETIIDENKPTEPSFYHTVNLNPIVGNLCNLACLMCSSKESSRYGVEQIRLGEVSKDYKPLVKHNFTKAEWTKLVHIGNKAEELKFVGGEPLMAENVFQFLSLIKQPAEKTIRIVTNLTNNVDRFVEISKSFKQVIYNVSVEGVGEVNDYIRYPSKWNTIIKNLDTISKQTNARIVLVSTVNALNISRLPEIISLGIPFSFGSLVTNNFYSINSIPDDVKDKYLNQLYSYGLRDKKVIQLIKFLENTRYEKQDMYNMLSHLKRRDNIRGTSLLDVFPEWGYHYNKVSGV